MRKRAERHEKLVSRCKTKGGIKAIITCGDLGSILCAARKWYNYQSEQGFDETKLLHHIANAEKVYLKFNRRNKSAFDIREQRRAERELESEVEPTTTATQSMQDGSGFDEESKKSVWSKLGDAIRPTRW